MSDFYGQDYNYDASPYLREPHRELINRPVMSKRVVGIAAILVLLPLLAVACGGAATPTPTPSPTVTPTPLPTGNIQEEPPEGWVASQNL